jgi:hypothetical protein
MISASWSYLLIIDSLLISSLLDDLAIFKGTSARNVNQLQKTASGVSGKNFEGSEYPLLHGYAEYCTTKNGIMI